MTANGRIIVTAAGPHMLPLLRKYALPTFGRLARALGADLHSVDLDADSSDYLSDQASRARWAKLDAIEQALADGYPEVLWLDADILVVRYDDDPFRYLRAGDFQGFVLEHNSAEARTNPNTGVWLVRNTPMARAFMSGVKMIGELPGSTWNEQAAVIQALGWDPGIYNHHGARPGRGTEFLRHTTVLPAPWNQLYIDMADPGRNCPVVPHPHVIHFAGMVVLAEREAAMRECYEARARDIRPA
jgi:hypothetical protein